MSIRHYFNTRSMALWILVLCLGGCGIGGDGTETPDISWGDIHAPVDAKLVHGALLVARIVINGSKSLEVLVDTGASGTYLPAEIFDDPGVGQVFISSLCFENEVCFHNFMARSSISAFAQSQEGYFNGIIGMNLLRNLDLTFDYQNRLIYFYDTLERENTDPVTIPIAYQANRPFADVRIEDIPQGMNLLDTGAAFTRITPRELDSLAQKPDVRFNTIVFNFDGSEVVEYLSLNDYCVSVACQDGIIVQAGSWPAIGGTFFREFMTVFKFSENVVKLDRYPDRDHIQKSGIQRIGIQINIFDASEIVYVIPASFAWNAGIREGFEIISVNEIPIDALGYFGIYELLSDIYVYEYDIAIATQADGVKNVSISTH